MACAWTRAAALVAVALGILACSNDGGGSCDPGEARNCACGSSLGVQSCGGDGAWGACACDGVPMGDGGVPLGTDGGGGGGGGGGGTCCLNDVGYRCPDDASFDRCAGFDLDACFSACDPADFACTDRCFDMASAATHDPSGCTQDDSVTCGSTGSCVGTRTGAGCDYDADCSTNNCFENQCYETSAGNPCEYDADCATDNCYMNCCYGTGSGEPCEYDADCASNNCYENRCQ